MFRVRKQVCCGWEYTGKNVTVAVLDTGISKHPDFGGRILAFSDFVNGRAGLYDDEGHGSHVSGILGGDGRLSGGKYRGIAPQCSLVVGKVLNGRGDGTIEHMVQGIEWVLRNRSLWNIRVLNISAGLGTHLGSERKKLLLSCVEEAWRQGLVVVAAAGNAGAGSGALSPIGNSDKMITVGCAGSGCPRGEKCPDGVPLSWEEGDGRRREADVTAPGTDVISCNSRVRRTFYGWQNAYTSKSGASMAAPVVAGAAALYLEKEPESPNYEIKHRILRSAADFGDPRREREWGLLNIDRMLHF